MLPYSAVAAIDYAAYQSRPGLSQVINNGASFTHSWLVPTQDLCGVNFKPNQQQNQLIVDPGHVEKFFIFYIFLSFTGADSSTGIFSADNFTGEMCVDVDEEVAGSYFVTWEKSFSSSNVYVFPAANPKVIFDVSKSCVKFKSAMKQFFSLDSSSM
jgi:hypothetical protein